ncbi:general secretion pathway protein F [Caulobacter ginsengisoli]|uniref:General secretion pathway protein F n=1 Tax=Caulobacter ginsengisoli TaxID=400775 RepID=A0ABU0IUQ7_9CAUL|nr:type II secretion system F family protein [Caulobacter ginsengisoli]MDQ0465744.1 general secretion pathway protein F [Caulobacter ginsengisoli]
MTAFAYRGMDANGRPVRGRREAADETQLRDGLLAEKVTPLTITPLVASLAPQPSTRLSLNEAQAGAFCADIARFLKSGLSLGQTLQIIETTAEQPQAARLAHHVRGELMAGRPFSAALDMLPGQTGRYLQALAKAGEATGRLTDILSGGAAALKASSAAKNRLLTMIIYPMFVMAMAAGAITLFAFVVLPALEPAFAGVTNLPTSTRVVLAAGRILRQAAPLIGLGLAGLIAAIAFVAPVRALAQRLLYGLMLSPVGLGILADTVYGSLARRLAIAIGAGVPLASAFKVSVEAIGIEALRRPLEAQEARLREGAKLSGAFAATRAPVLLVSLTKVGETASDLPRVLDEAGEAMAVRAAERTERLLALLTPAIVLSIGLVVGTIVLVVFQGLLAISQSVDV